MAVLIDDYSALSSVARDPSVSVRHMDAGGNGTPVEFYLTTQTTVLYVKLLYNGTNGNSLRINEASSQIGDLLEIYTYSDPGTGSLFFIDENNDPVSGLDNISAGGKLVIRKVAANTWRAISN